MENIDHNTEKLVTTNKAGLWIRLPFDHKTATSLITKDHVYDCRNTMHGTLPTCVRVDMTEDGHADVARIAGIVNQIEKNICWNGDTSKLRAKLAIWWPRTATEIRAHLRHEDWVKLKNYTRYLTSFAQLANTSCHRKYRPAPLAAIVVRDVLAKAAATPGTIASPAIKHHTAKAKSAIAHVLSHVTPDNYLEPVKYLTDVANGRERLTCVYYESVACSLAAIDALW